MTTIAEPAVLDVQGVSKRFAGVVALDDVSLELRAGQVHALVGENGAGKSTLIKVLTGVHQPDQGTIVYRGEPVTFARPLDAQAAGISTIYQEVNLVPLMSVARNLFLGREPTRLGLIDFARMHREATASLARYGIHVDVRRPLRELGLGVQQMVAIARAIDADHRVVIMDEPTSSLEPREVERLMEVVDLLRRDGVAVVYVSHRLDEVFRLCDAVTVLRDGRRVHTGPIAEITRLELVSTMLGRELSRGRPSQDAVRNATTRRRSRAAAAGDRPDAPACARRRRRSRRAPARWSASPASSVGPDRDRQGHLRRAAPRQRRGRGRRRRGPPGLPAGRDLGRHRPDPRGPQGRRHHPDAVRAREHRARGAADVVPRRVRLGRHRTRSSRR